MDYRPLDGSKNEIRLLTILPSENSSSRSLCCHLEYFSLDDLKDGYTAEGQVFKLKEFKLGPFRETKQLLHPNILYLTARPGFLYLFFRVLINLFAFSWRRLFLHVVDLGLLESEWEKTRNQILTMHFSVDDIQKLNAAHNMMFSFAVYSHYSLSWASALFGAHLICLWYLANNSSWILKHWAFKIWPKQSYAQEIQSAYFHFEPQPDSFRYVWGDYAALSYVWGPQDPASMRDIVVNNKVIRVGCNLEAALRAMQDSTELRAGLKLWVDSICINQNDIMERSHQVRRMRAIYSGARSIIVWLGEADADTHKAMELITLLSFQFRYTRGSYETQKPLRGSL